MKWKKTISFFLAVSMAITGIIGGLGPTHVQAASTEMTYQELAPLQAEQPESDGSQYVYQLFSGFSSTEDDQKAKEWQKILCACESLPYGQWQKDLYEIQL